MSKTATAPQAITGKPNAFAAAMSVAPAAAKPEGDGEQCAEGSDGDDGDDEKQKEGESDEDYAKRKKNKKAKADDKKEDEAEAADPEDKEKEAAARHGGTMAERARWETVLKSTAAAGKGAVACEMLAGTSMAAPRIITALSAISVSSVAGTGGGGLNQRMAENKVEAPGPDVAGSGKVEAGAPVTSDMVIAAAKKLRGEK